MIRIITGEFKGRRLETPRDASKTRPLPDRVRTAIFNMLAGHYEGQAFVDAFAGTGSFGLEAISRGASHCLFIERDRQIAGLLRQNIESLGVGDRAELMHADALGLAVQARCPRPVHVINFDPPYPMMEDPQQRRLILEQFTRLAEHLDEDGFALLRTPHPFYEPRREDEPISARVEVDMALPGLAGPETHVYGSTAVHWYGRLRQSSTAESDPAAG
ncbi:MAG: RsmD family RNA methyltransferase [Phycisphaerales bacterium]|nr:RsmD family RNA methyltransferase [Phycisphaerales bacterium]